MAEDDLTQESQAAGGLQQMFPLGEQFPAEVVIRRVVASYPVDASGLLRWMFRGRVSAPGRWGSAPAELAALAQRMSKMEHQVDYGMRPVLAKLSELLEQQQFVEKDSLPGATAAAYEWSLRSRGLAGAVESLRDSFAEPDKRLDAQVKLIDKLRELVPIARGARNDHLRDATLTLLDAVESVYAEDMTEEQLGVITEGVRALESTSWDLAAVRELDRSLLTAGLETIPSDVSYSARRSD